MRLPRNEGKRRGREPSRRPARHPGPTSLDSRRSASSHSAISYGIAVPRSGVSGPQLRPLNLTCCKSQPGTTVLMPGGALASVPSQFVEPNPAETSVWRRIRIDGFYFIFLVRETFSKRSGSTP